jgi:uncharacterized protein with gpF-like domain
MEFKESPQISQLEERGKNIVITTSWDKLTSQEHSKAFTIANLNKADLLEFINKELVKSEKEGKSLDEFKKSVMPRLMEHGWWGSKITENPVTREKKLIKQGSEARLKLIYETNLRTSRAQGRLQTQNALVKIRPIWVYKQIDRKGKNKDHTKFDGKAFYHNDKIWSSIYPPSDFGCGCSVTAISEASAKKRGINIDRGSKYNDFIKGSDNFKIKPKEVFEGDLSKYNPALKKKLKKALALAVMKKLIEKKLRKKNPKIEKLRKAFHNVVKNKIRLQFNVGK